MKWMIYTRSSLWLVVIEQLHQSFSFSAANHIGLQHFDLFQVIDR